MAGKKNKPGSGKPPQTAAEMPRASLTPPKPTDPLFPGAKNPVLQVPAGFKLPGLPPIEPPFIDELPTLNYGRLTRRFKWLTPVLLSLIIISFIPLTGIYLVRANNHQKVNRVSIIPDMDNQPRWKTQQANYMFADHRASRPWPEGTVRASAPLEDGWFDHGIVKGQWATALPPQVTIDQALLDRGKERFHIYCSPCHGESGYGDGTVAKRAELLREGTWTVPLNYHTDQVRTRPVGHIFNTITNGIRTMPPYGSQIPVEDRWAIVAWIRVLQASQDVDVNSLPSDQRERLLQTKPKVETPPAAPVDSKLQSLRIEHERLLAQLKAQRADDAKAIDASFQEAKALAGELEAENKRLADLLKQVSAATDQKIMKGQNKAHNDQLASTAPAGKQAGGAR